MKTNWDFEQGDEIAPGRVAVKRLGGGHRYEAYLAWDDKLFSLVVVKVVRPDQVDQASVLRGLSREVRMLRRLSHPVLLRSFEAVLDGPRPHVVLEHLEGPRLSTLLRKYGRLPMEQLLPLALEVCSALHYLSTEAVVHLDVKPSNIIMGAPPRLIDLSIARSIDEAAALDSSVGTDDYMAPEQCEPAAGSGPGPAADVWGLGVTLFEASAGYLPFSRGVDDKDAETTQRWPQMIEEPAALPRATPDAVAKPILACLDKDPSARPAPVELAHLLEPLAGSLPRPILGLLKPRLH
ncbi:MAG: serine/threonine protein kinase [Actinomycetota bacterium]|nr:serine/threonine protein kinase [Actinomycetota bacterium]